MGIFTWEHKLEQKRDVWGGFDRPTSHNSDSKPIEERTQLQESEPRKNPTQASWVSLVQVNN